MNKFILGISIMACNSYNHDSSELLIEDVKCSHPDSRYEGVVEVFVRDEQSWESVQFVLSQGEYEWETSLMTLDGFNWETRMQLYELDCFQDYEWDLLYESR